MHLVIFDFYPLRISHKSGVDCMDTCMFSGPTEAREAATVTFTLVGKRRIASAALPEKQYVAPFAKNHHKREFL